MAKSSQPLNRTRRPGVGYQVRRITTGTRRVARVGLSNVSRARQATVSSIARGLAFNKGKKMVAATILAGLMIAPHANARQTQVPRETFLDSATVNTRTDEGSVDVLGIPHKQRYKQNEAIELAAKQILSRARPKLIDGLLETVPKNVLTEFDKIKGDDKVAWERRVSVLTANLNKQQIDEIHRLIEIEARSNPQIRAMTEQVDNRISDRQSRIKTTLRISQAVLFSVWVVAALALAEKMREKRRD